MMNSDMQQYDMVVLGFDEKAEETAHALKELGKRALYIPIDPQMVITLMTQKQSGSLTEKSISAINVHQHKVETPLETVTYFLQPEVITETVNEEKSVTEEADDHIVALQNDEEDTYQEIYTQKESDELDELVTTHESDELDVLVTTHESDEVNTAPEEPDSFPIITPLAKESSLIDNRFLGIRKNSAFHEQLQKNGKNTESMISAYHLFNPIRIEEDELEIESNTTEDLSETQSSENTSEKFLDISTKSMTEIDSFEDLSLESDIENELDMPDLLLEQEIEEETVEEVEEETADDHQPLVLDRDLRLRKKLSFNNRHHGSKTSIVNPLNIEKAKQTKNEEEPPKKPEIFPLEPFSSRRRNKKNRLFSSLENTFPNQVIPQTPTPKANEPANELEVPSLLESSIIQEEDFTVTKSEKVEKEKEQKNTDNLKIDTIEFEEPYGYNSFEDIFPSFSTNQDRKRQELDKIEKRKIALRGLHNLINNLG